MAIDPFIPSSSIGQRNGDLFVKMRAQLDDLQRQLSTGKKSDGFAELGLGRRVSLDARSKIATLEGWNKGIEMGDLRIKFMNQSIEGFARQTQDGKGDARPGAYVMGANGTVAGQVLARERMAQSIDMLNAEVGGRYLFSGRSHDVKPVETLDVIMNGDGAGRAGVRQLISERQQADAGATDLGRLTNTLAGTSVTIAREAANPPYGFTLAGASSTSAGIAATFTAGPPASVGFNVAANPNPGEKVSFVLNLPDGSTETVELEARLPTTGGSPATGFAIGATPAATAANLQASVTAALQAQTATSLNAASAIVAARDFFAGSNSSPPVRVPGPSFATATAAPAAVIGATVIWYKGDDDPAFAARSTSTLQVDDQQVVATGARANEEAFREGLAAFAVYSATSFSASDPNSRDRYEAMADRVRSQLSFETAQKPQDIGTEIAAAQVSMNAAKDRHKASINFLEAARAGVEDASQEEVAASLLALQTRLQATYQTTAMLSRLTLTSYLN